MMQIQNTIAQEDALSLSYDCESTCIDLQINGGIGPYDVEWQKYLNGNWIRLKGWPKNDLSGSTGAEDLCVGLPVSEPTEFKVIVYDALCGTAEATITIEPCEPEPSSCENFGVIVENYTNVSSCGGFDDIYPPPPPYDACDGSITISISGGNSGSFSAQWSNGASGLSISGLCTGTYTVTVTQGSCTATETFELCCCSSSTPSQGPFPHCTSTSVVLDGDITSPSSGTASDGAIDLIVTPAGGNIKYKWSGPSGFNAKTQDISGLKVGTYCVTVTTGCGEPLTRCFTLVDCSLVTINVTGTVTNTCQGYNVGAVSASPSGGNGPYKYKWSNGKTSSSINSLAVGQYCVTATDQNGCKGTACFNVGLNPIVVTRSGCTFTERCNGIVVNTYSIGSYSVTNPTDCRYRDSYCNDGYFLGSTFVGTYFEIVNNCTVYERCRTNTSIYNIHNGVNRSTTLRGFDPRRNCWWCNTATYCEFPTLGNWINPNSISFSPIGDGYNYGTTEGGCTLQGGIKGCMHRVYCNYQVIDSWCVPGVCITTEQPCVGGNLGLKYEVITESLKNKDGYLETIYKYNLLSFDTTSAVDFIKNDLVALENKLSEDIMHLKGEPIIDPTSSIRSKPQYLISIYPNPAFDELTLQFDSRRYKEEMTMELFDITGKVVNSILIENNQIGIVNIPIDHLLDGLYLMRLKNKIDNQIIHTDKIIKNSK